VQEWTKQADGRRPRTQLYTRFREHFGVTNDEYFIHDLNVNVITGNGLPELQRLLAEIWKTGDPAAAAIYERGAEELWNGIRVTAEKLGLTGTEYPVSYSGGLFKAGECALAPLRRKIENAGAKLVDPAFSPEVGALIMAIRHKNPNIDQHNFRICE
jgi:N-acetylglucosamine kinase-like BadF-type ATPase